MKSVSLCSSARFGTALGALTLAGLVGGSSAQAASVTSHDTCRIDGMSASSGKSWQMSFPTDLTYEYATGPVQDYGTHMLAVPASLKSLTIALPPAVVTALREAGLNGASGPETEVVTGQGWTGAHADVLDLEGASPVVHASGGSTPVIVGSWDQDANGTHRDTITPPALKRQQSIITLSKPTGAVAIFSCSPSSAASAPPASTTATPPAAPTAPNATSSPSTRASAPATPILAPTSSPGATPTTQAPSSSPVVETPSPSGEATSERPSVGPRVETDGPTMAPTSALTGGWAIIVGGFVIILTLAALHSRTARKD